MAAETASVRNQARRVKNLALTKAEEVLANPEKNAGIYEQTFLTVLKNSVPRTQEVTGEDGGPVQLDITRKEQIEQAINDII